MTQAIVARFHAFLDILARPYELGDGVEAARRHVGSHAPVVAALLTIATIISERKP